LVADKGLTLDVGCGDGTIGAALDSPCVVACDISFRCAVLSGRRGLRAVVADAIAALPFANEAFQTIYCVDVLHHLNQQWDSIFAGLDRILRPGGTLVIVEPDAHNPFVRWTQAPHSPIRVAPFDNEPAIYPEELAPHLTRLGYDFQCNPITIEGSQVERSVFSLWQRLLKAPFVLALAAAYSGRPNKFAIVATKRRKT
jgi:SAM-dependent methyltransferase